MIDDLIRRSDAIEAIEVVDWYHQNRNKDMVSGANSDEHQAWYKADDIYEALEAVPSADRKTEPTSSKMEQVEEDINVRSKDEPTTQTGTQNSNLTFEKDECAKEYEELGLKELKELIEADRKTEPQTDNLFTDKDGDVWEWRGDAWYCISGDEPQTERSE